ncbi:unnamed protein product [Arabidopsis thaliana]|uniref:Uncharacterized protein n=1 Tax=Arabidopsis thaliana TaxID=3702 RepID=A0A654EIH7_ARATH|nr:unnamed protein product [Arabidopsis thaliana]
MSPKIVKLAHERLSPKIINLSNERISQRSSSSPTSAYLRDPQALTQAPISKIFKLSHERLSPKLSSSHTSAYLQDRQALPRAPIAKDLLALPRAPISKIVELFRLLRAHTSKDLKALPRTPISKIDRQALPQAPIFKDLPALPRAPIIEDNQALLQSSIFEDLPVSGKYSPIASSLLSPNSRGTDCGIRALPSMPNSAQTQIEQGKKAPNKEERPIRTTTHQNDCSAHHSSAHHGLAQPDKFRRAKRRNRKRD